MSMTIGHMQAEKHFITTFKILTVFISFVGCDWDHFDYCEFFSDATVQSRTMILFHFS